MAQRHYRLATFDRSADYLAGHRHGVRACVQWLHQRAREMNDPKATAILNSAAFNLGAEASHAREGCRCHYEGKMSADCPVHGENVRQWQSAS